MKVDFIGIGAQKSATTWVYSILEDHPSVSMSVPKELDFFSRQVNFLKGNTWYHQFFYQEKSSTTLFGEISPSYMRHPFSAIRAKEYNPNLKVVITLRDPVDRAFSNHLHLIRRNKIQKKNYSFESSVDNFPSYIEQSRYYSQLQSWYRHFPRNQLLVLMQEEIKKNPNKEAMKLYDFLGIDSNFNSSNTKKNANVSTVVKYPRIENFFRIIAQLANNRRFGRVVENAKKNSLIQKIRGTERHLIHDVPAMKQETKYMLMNYFSDDVLNLAKLLKVKSLPWKTWEYMKDSSKLDIVEHSILKEEDLGS